MCSQFGNCQTKVFALHNLSALCCELLLSTFTVDFNQQRSWVLGRASEGLGLHVFVKVVTCICQISYTYLWFLTNGRVECSVWHLRGLGGLRVLGQSEEANPTCTFVALPPAAIFCQHHLNHLDSPESQGVWTSVAIFRCNDCVVCYFVSELITIQTNSKWRKACIFLHPKNKHRYMNGEPRSSVKHFFVVHEGFSNEWWLEHLTKTATSSK